MTNQTKQYVMDMLRGDIQDARDDLDLAIMRESPEKEAKEKNLRELLLIQKDFMEASRE